MLSPTFLCPLSSRLAFADDTNIAVKDKKINLTDTMNTELEKINDWWYIANKLILHFDKSAILFLKGKKVTSKNAYMAYTFVRLEACIR